MPHVLQTTQSGNPSDSPHEIYEQLRKLVELQARGLISEAQVRATLDQIADRVADQSKWRAVMRQLFPSLTRG
jgi:hypothetical protein